jgi:hypothetical protein
MQFILRQRGFAFLVLVSLYTFGRPTHISATSTGMWDECDNVCGDSTQCNTSCFDNPIQFENGNPTTCLLDGYPYDTTQACCGDGLCDRSNDEQNVCPADCTVNICVSSGCSPESLCGDSEACDADGCCFNQCSGSSCGADSRSCGLTGSSCESDNDCCAGTEACEGNGVFIGFDYDSDTDSWDIPVWNLQYYCAAAAMRPLSMAHH